MYIIVLRPADRARAGETLAGHQAWLQQGKADGIFLLWGSLKPEGGGCILAQGEDRAAMERRVAADPFVAGGVVTPEIIEITPAHAVAELDFLLGNR